MRTLICALFTTLIALGVIPCSALPAKSEERVVMAAPPGITFQLADKLPPYLANSAGTTLYINDHDRPGQSSCVSNCDTRWQPLRAMVDARAFGDWSVVKREDGVAQWAYRDSALYIFAEDSEIGDINGIGGDGNHWHVAIIAPSMIPTPGEASIQRSVNAAGDILVDTRGMTIYTFDDDANLDGSACEDTCAERWKPLLAGQLALPFGGWSLVRRNDGSRQWTYAGRPLYTFTGDLAPSEIRGESTDTRWHVARIRRYYMPPAVTTWSTWNGRVMLVKDGHTLYTGDLQKRDYDSNTPTNGTSISTEMDQANSVTDYDQEYTQPWIPFLAPTDATASGYWSVLNRSDGTRQWAYQGKALYSHRGDQKLGDMRGNARWTQIGNAMAVFWQVATP